VANGLWFLVGVLLSGLVALVPMVIYALALWWCDRYEREPLGLVLAAFAWGAGPAIVLAFIWESILGAPLVGPSSGLVLEVVNASLLVPAVEEVVKGLALVGVLLFFSREFDDVLDGIVYGGLVGFGFAMTENFFYFLGAFTSLGIGDWVLVVFLRGLVFGLNHAFFSALVGAGIGLAKQWGMRWRSVGVAALGFAAAMYFHAAHNLGSTLTAVTPCALGFSLLSDAGGVIVLAVVFLVSLRREKEWIAQELAFEVGGSLSKQEFAYLTSHWRALARISWPLGRRSRWADLMTELALKRRQARQRGRDPEDDALVLEIRRRIAHLSKAMVE